MLDQIGVVADIGRGCKGSWDHGDECTKQ